jgi:archaellum component FlaF (FlaF/FlaG flagellin family)
MVYLVILLLLSFVFGRILNIVYIDENTRLKNENQLLKDQIKSMLNKK